LAPDLTSVSNFASRGAGQGYFAMDRTADAAFIDHLVIMPVALHPAESSRGAAAVGSCSDHLLFLVVFVCRIVRADSCVPQFEYSNAPVALGCRQTHICFRSFSQCHGET